MTGIRNVALVLAATASLALAAAPARAQSGHLTIQQIGDALTSYGKNTVNNNGQTYYIVNCGNGNWKGQVLVSLSPDSSVVWMTIDPSSLPDGDVSIQALADLLSKNTDIGPLFFSLNRRRVRLSYPVANAGLTEASVKADLKELVDTAVDTMKLWDPANLAAK
jgi:hypothetical protein